jgi:hypothetical protein
VVLGVLVSELKLKILNSLKTIKMLSLLFLLAAHSSSVASEVDNIQRLALDHRMDVIKLSILDKQQTF